MNCIVTAGPTFEPLDEVRRLTNFSTGRLGCELAQFLAHAGHSVTLLLGQQATHQPPAGVALQRFTTTANLREHLQKLAGPGVDAVFHAAAVSDFAPGKVFVRGSRGSTPGTARGQSLLPPPRPAARTSANSKNHKRPPEHSSPTPASWAGNTKSMATALLPSRKRFHQIAESAHRCLCRQRARLRTRLWHRTRR